MSSTFQIPRWYWLLLTGMGLSTHFMISFYPSVIPYEYLGPVGSLTRYLAYDMNILNRIAFYIMCVVHVFEGFYALVLARRMNAGLTDQCLWYLQTTIVGVSSLNLIKSKVKKHKSN